MDFGSAPPVTSVKQPRRRDPKQTAFEFRPTGRGGARPGAGRPRKYRSRMPHRSRERIPGYCPVLVTLRVRDDVPKLRRAGDLRAFRDSLRQASSRAGFRVVHYAIQDDHVHLIVEAAGKTKLANGMKSVGARFARCVNRTFGRRGAVLKERFHHMVKRSPPPGRYADRSREREVAAAGTWLLDGLAADRADRSGGGAGGIAGPLRLSQDIETRVRRGRLRPDGQSAWRVVHASSTATVPK